MRAITSGLLLGTIRHLHDHQISGLVKNIHLKAEQEKILYHEAQIANRIESIEILLQTYSVQGEFKFLGAFFETSVQKKSFHLLPLPLFSVDREDFKGVVEKITGRRYAPGLVKKFGKKTEEFGVAFLNNVYLLCQIYLNSNLNLDQVLNLDHSQQLTPQVIAPAKSLLPILESYSLNRAFKVLTPSNQNYLEETTRLLQGENELTRVLEQLPSKPRSFKDIHDSVSITLLKKNRPDLPLNQDIAFLHGKILKNFVIQVPATSFDLISTSMELNHCVHGYDRMVIKKECQIINLTRFGKRHYTIELRPENGGYVIAQFKGKANDSTMEGHSGDGHRQELQRLLNMNAGQER
jgi:hypothetical protein